MQATRVQCGDSLDYTPNAAVASGAVVVVGSLAIIADRPIVANEFGALSTKGLYDIVKANEEINDGAACYWDADGNPYGGTAGTGCVTATSAGNTFIGYAWGAAGATTSTVRVIVGYAPAVTVSVRESLSASIADPGSGGAIPVTNSGSVQIVTAGAETRTIAAPTFLGQQLALSLKTDGGDCTITVATTINQTGNNTITLNDAGDFVSLTAKQNGANLRWSVTVNDGATLSTV